MQLCLWFTWDPKSHGACSVNYSIQSCELCQCTSCGLQTLSNSSCYWYSWIVMIPISPYLTSCKFRRIKSALNLFNYKYCKNSLAMQSSATARGAEQHDGMTHLDVAGRKKAACQHGKWPPQTSARWGPGGCRFLLLYAAFKLIK